MSNSCKYCSTGAPCIDTELHSKRIFIRLERTESLLNLVSTLRAQFVGESQNALDDFMTNFDPHISLAYADAFVADKGVLEDLQSSLNTFAKNLDLSQSFQFIVLMDTRSRSTTNSQEVVREWKACPIRLSL